jgi:hypothetical protein
MLRLAGFAAGFGVISFRKFRVKQRKNSIKSRNPLDTPAARFNLPTC